MAPTLIRRVISYFLLLYGQLAIIRYCLFKNTDLDASLLAGLEWDNIVAKAAARTAYWGTQPNGQYFWKLKALSGLATLLLIWLVVWWWFSDITFFFCCSHFLYDQDPGDLPFWLDSLYPLPLFIITAGLGVAYLAIIYGAKIGAEATSAQAEHLRQSLGDQ